MKPSEERRGQATGPAEAYAEGYAAKYDEWLDRSNPYPAGSAEAAAFDEGYAEAVAFA